MKSIGKKFTASILVVSSLCTVPSSYAAAYSNDQISTFCFHRGHNLSYRQCCYLYKILKFFAADLKKNKSLGKSLSYLEEKNLVALEKLFNNEPLNYSECFLIDKLIDDIIK